MRLILTEGEIRASEILTIVDGVMRDRGEELSEYICNRIKKIVDHPSEGLTKTIIEIVKEIMEYRKFTDERMHPIEIAALLEARESRVKIMERFSESNSNNMFRKSA